MELRTNVENVPREFGLSVGMDLSKEFGHIICQCGICRRESLVWLSQFFYLDQHSVQSARILKTKPCVHTAGAPRVPSNAWLVSSVQWMLEKWQVKVRDLRIAGRGTMVASETHTHRLDSFFFLRNTFRALALSFSNVTLHKDEVQTVRKGADGAD